MSTTNYAKMTTVILKKKLSTAKTAEEKKAIQAVLNKRNGQAPKGEVKGRIIEFTSRRGVKVKGEVVSVLVGKRDGKTYLGVKMGDKMYFRQEQSVV